MEDRSLSNREQVPRTFSDALASCTYCNGVWIVALLASVGDLELQVIG